MKNRKILLVDDDPKELEKHARILSQAGHTVFTARGGREATGILKKHGGDIAVISGFSSKRGGGNEFMRNALKAHPALPFTVLARSPSFDSAMETMREGAFDILRKPVSGEELRRSAARSVQRMSERRKKRRNDAELRNAKALSSFKGFIVAMAAHDFRTILTVLEGYLQFMREKCGKCTVNGTGEMLEGAMRAAARMQRMVGTLLDHEAAETGRLRPESKSIPLGEVLHECEGFYRPYADQKRIALSLDWDGPEILVKGDRRLLLEILDNLVYNALKFTPAGGAVRISGCKGYRCGKVTVIDTGPGIPKGKLKKVVRREVPIGGRDASERLGMGLEICKCLVEAQNGKIRVNSVFGKGTQVSFSLPAM